MADYGKAVGMLHLSSAGLALIGFGLFMEITSIVLIRRSFRNQGDHPESNLPMWARNGLYFATLLCSIIGSLLFLTWILKLAKTQSSTAPINEWEWAGLSLMFSSL